MPKLDVILGSLESAECHPRQYGNRWRAKCPSHGSKGGTLLVDDKGWFHCFAGCEKEQILDSLGLVWKDLFDDDRPFVPRPRPKKREVPAYTDPVGAAKRAGVLGEHLGSGVFAGVCPHCEGPNLSVGRGGIVCADGCREAEGLVLALADFADARRIMIGVRVVKTLEILGCFEERSGISQKTNKPWTLYKVHANDENGVAIGETLKSFQELPLGKGSFNVEKNDHPEYGVSFTVSQPSPLMQRIDALEKRIEALEGKKVEVAPAPEPVVVASTNGIPF